MGSSRRALLRALAGVGTVGLAGCGAFNNVKVTPEDNGDETPDSQTETPTVQPTESTPTPPTAVTFEFSYTGEVVRIEHAGGPPISATDLVIQHANREIMWYELGSTTTTENGEITEGDVATLGPDVLNWEAEIDDSGIVRLVFFSSGGSPTTLATYEPRLGVSETPTETPVQTATPAPSADVLFLDEFDDGEFLNVWTYQAEEKSDALGLEERDGVLVHEAPERYGDEYHGDIFTQETFQTSGRIKLTARIRPLSAEYWGYGFGVRFSNTNQVLLQNHRWEAFDRFGVFGVENRPEEFATGIDGYGDQSHVAKLGSATTETEFETYSMTIDIAADELLSVRRGIDTYVEQMDIGATSDRFQVQIGGDAGHEIEIDYIRLELLATE